jgi:hypothetical protein
MAADHSFLAGTERLPRLDKQLIGNSLSHLKRYSRNLLERNVSVNTDGTTPNNVLYKCKKM